MFSASISAHFSLQYSGSSLDIALVDSAFFLLDTQLFLSVSRPTISMLSSSEMLIVSFSVLLSSINSFLLLSSLFFLSVIFCLLLPLHFLSLPLTFLPFTAIPCLMFFLSLSALIILMFKFTFSVLIVLTLAVVPADVDGAAAPCTLSYSVTLSVSTFCILTFEGLIPYSDNNSSSDFASHVDLLRGVKNSSEFSASDLDGVPLTPAPSVGLRFSLHASIVPLTDCNSLAISSSSCHCISSLFSDGSVAVSAPSSRDVIITAVSFSILSVVFSTESLPYIISGHPDCRSAFFPLIYSVLIA